MSAIAVEPPRAPIHAKDIGLSLTFQRDLLLKTIFRMNLQSVSQMSDTCAVAPPIIDELISLSRDENLIETLGQRDAESSSEMRYQLTDGGRARAMEALDQSQYFGAFPVPLDDFANQTKRQSITHAAITRSDLEAACSHLILPSGLLDALGPAVNSGRSILLYGPPGNGKSALSQAIRDALKDHVYIPRVLEVAGQIITVFDPAIHRKIDMPESGSGLRRTATHDARYVMCLRPCVVAGGELTLDMLDLGYSEASRIYQAPLQLKATGGLFILDDLGRQRESAQALMNRWIVPIEQRFDLLSLQSGQKFTVPFETLAIFSTNFAPQNLFDGAALRRIYYKIRIDGPDRNDFIKMFIAVSKKYGMRLDEQTLGHLLQRLYPKQGADFSAFHAPFLIDQMNSICIYEERPPQMSVELIERAWENLFVREAENTL